MDIQQHLDGRDNPLPVHGSPLDPFSPSTLPSSSSSSSSSSAGSPLKNGPQTMVDVQTPFHLHPVAWGSGQPTSGSPGQASFSCRGSTIHPWMDGCLVPLPWLTLSLTSHPSSYRARGLPPPPRLRWLGEDREGKANNQQPGLACLASWPSSFQPSRARNA